MGRRTEDSDKFKVELYDESCPNGSYSVIGKAWYHRAVAKSKVTASPGRVFG